MPHHHVNGREIYVDSVGDGDAVIAVHGLGATSNFWWPFHAMAQSRMRVIAPDTPSSGRSANDAHLSIDSISSDLLALMDMLGLQSAHLLGHSMGTIVCQHMAARSPERVRSLALLGPLAEPPEPARGALSDRASLARTSGMEPITAAILDAALAGDTKSANPLATGYVRELVSRQDPEGYAQSCLALAGARAADVSALTCPVLLVTGDEDKVAPPAAVEALASRFSNLGRNVVLNRCGHWTLLERPTETLQLLGDFYGP